jgi:hypothetical protein
MTLAFCTQLTEIVDLKMPTFGMHDAFKFLQSIRPGAVYPLVFIA